MQRERSGSTSLAISNFNIVLMLMISGSRLKLVHERPVPVMDSEGLRVTLFGRFGAYVTYYDKYRMSSTRTKPK
jgi:hypothetical protein